LATILHLAIPGLLGPFPTALEFPRPQADALERLLACAEVKPLGVKGFDATLFKLFQLPVHEAQELPVASVTHLADAGVTDHGWWLRADPVYLRPDLHQVLLFDARHLAISTGTAQSLVTEFNAMFRADDLLLEAPHPQRWYLHIAKDPGLRTEPLIAAIGQDINPLLPRGQEARHWHRLLTEIQMLLHSSQVNVAREANGQLPINGIWIWGGGQLPQGARSPSDGFYGRGPLTRGLARLAGVAVNPVPDNIGDWYRAAEHEREGLVVLETSLFDGPDKDSQAWCEHVNTLERNWFAPGMALLTSKALQALYLYPCNGWIYILSAGKLRRFWRRTRALLQYIK
jgi:hypothetical protein